MDTARIGRRRRPQAVTRNKGYSYPRIRVWCWRRGIEVVIRAQLNQLPQQLDRAKYRRRDAVQRRVRWLKESRRVAPDTRSRRRIVRRWSSWP